MNPSIVDRLAVIDDGSWETILESGSLDKSLDSILGRPSLKSCQKCLADSAIHTCSGCTSRARYCSIECQTADWPQTHKDYCKWVRAQRSRPFAGLPPKEILARQIRTWFAVWDKPISTICMDATYTLRQYSPGKQAHITEDFLGIHLRSIHGEFQPAKAFELDKMVLLSRDDVFREGGDFAQRSSALLAELSQNPNVVALSWVHVWANGDADHPEYTGQLARPVIIMKKDLERISPDSPDGMFDLPIWTAMQKRLMSRMAEGS